MRQYGAQRQRAIAVRLLLLHDDLTLTKGIAGHPVLPDIRLYRRRPRTGRPVPVLEHAA